MRTQNHSTNVSLSLLDRDLNLWNPSITRRNMGLAYGLDLKEFIGIDSFHESLAEHYVFSTAAKYLVAREMADGNSSDLVLFDGSIQIYRFADIPQMGEKGFISEKHGKILTARQLDFKGDLLTSRGLYKVIFGDAKTSEEKTAIIGAVLQGYELIDRGLQEI